jgi:hypothetical protein
MKSVLSARLSLAWLAVAGWNIPLSAAVAQNPQTLAASNDAIGNERVVRDIALAPGGLLAGEVLDAQRRPLPNAEVAVLAGDTTVVATHTDAHGMFAVTGLRGGVHQVRTPLGSQVCRLWAVGTAPPCAADSLRVSPVQTIVRGQGGPSYVHEPFPHARAIATHPLTVGGLLAAAIAIPAALNNADRPPGS